MPLAKWFQRILTRFVGSGGSFRSILTMLSGTALAQLITVLATIPLARLYSPTDFGYFAIVQSVVTVGTTLVALRYDVAIVLPEKDSEAKVLHRLASRLIIILSALIALVLLIAHRAINNHYNSSSFGWWLVISSAIIFTMAQIANIQNWLLRTRNFKLIARNRATASALMVVAQLALASVIGGFQGLILGMLLGQVLTLVALGVQCKELYSKLPLDAPKMTKMAYRYRKMPLLNAPNVVVDAVRNAGINVLIGNIALGGLGQYSLANRAVHAPVYLINGAISQVFLPRMASTKPGKMMPLIKSLLGRIGLVSAPIFVAFYFLAPWLIPFLFGQEWREAGLYAQALVPWLFFNTFTSPLSNVFVATEAQGRLLVFACFYAATPLIFLTASTMPLLTTIWFLSWIMAGLLVGMLVLSLWTARCFDARG